MSNEMLLFVAVANLVLLIWFIFAMNKLNANTQELVNLARELIHRSNTRPTTPAKPGELHDGMSATELLEAIEAGGGRLRLLDDVLGVDVVLDAPRGFDPKAAQLVKAKRKALVQRLRARKS